MGGDVGTRGKELKKLLALAKNKPLPFAYCPGGQVQDDIFILHRKKNPEVLGREARAEGEGSKIGFGRVEVTGKIVSLSCDRVIAGMAKKLKKYLIKENCRLNVKILDADGNTVEEDIEDLGDDDPLGDAEDIEPADTEQDAEPVSADDQLLEELKSRAAGLPPRIKALSPDVQPAVVNRFKAVAAALKSGDLDAAEIGLDAIENALQQLEARSETAAAAPPPPPAEDPAAIKLRTAASSLAGRIDKLAEGEGKTRLLAALNLLNGQIDASDYPKAVTTAKALGEAITKLSAAQTAAARDVAAEEAQQAAPEAASDEAASDDAADYAIPSAEEVNASEDGKTWNAARAELEPVILQLLGQQLGDTSKMRAAWAFFTEKGAMGAFAEAMKAVPGTRRLIEAAYQEQQSEAEKDVPSNVVEFVRARLDWSKLRPALDSELIKLQNAILATCQGEQFEGMAAETRTLFAHLKVLDNKLEAALDAVIGEADTDRRESLKAAARTVVGDLQSELGQGFFADVGNNGFVEVQLRDKAVSALARVDEVLQRPAA